MSDYSDRPLKPEEFGEYDPERKPFAAPGQIAPDRTGQLWWRGPADLNKNEHSCVLFRVIGPPKLRLKRVRDQNILGETVIDEEYDYVHPIEQIIPHSDYQFGRQWWEGYHSWESADHGPGSPSEYTRVHPGNMKIEDAWRNRVGQMWRRSDRREPILYREGPFPEWGNFVIVSSTIHENTCTVVHNVVYTDNTRGTIVEHGGATEEKDWSMDKDERFTRLS